LAGASSRCWQVIEYQTDYLESGLDTPDSDWVHAMKGVQAGEIIKASDSRNPIGRVDPYW